MKLQWLSVSIVAIGSLVIADVSQVAAQNYSQQGTRRGAVAGAVVGGLVGGRNNRPGLGIVVGGVGGALIGRAIGQQRDNEVYRQQFYQQPFNQQPHFQHPQFYHPQPQPGYYHPPQQGYPQPLPIHPSQHFHSPSQPFQQPMQTWPNSFPPFSVNVNDPTLVPLTEPSRPATLRNHELAGQVIPNLSAHQDNNHFRQSTQIRAKAGQISSVRSSNADHNLIQTNQGTVQTGERTTGRVQTGTVQTGSFPRLTNQLPAQADRDVIFVAPQPIPQGSQPYRHGW